MMSVEEVATLFSGWSGHLVFVGARLAKVGRRGESGLRKRYINAALSLVWKLQIFDKF